MIRNYLLPTLALVVLALGCSKDSIQSSEVQPNDPEVMSRTAINEYVLEQLKATNAAFEWSKANDHMLWSAISHGREIAVIGYQPAGFENINERIHEIDVTSGEWRSVRQELIQLVLSETQKYFPNENITEEDLLGGVPAEEDIPAFDILIKHPSIVTALRQRADVRYVEPMDYGYTEVNDRSGSGCDVSPSSNIPSADYTTVSPSGKVPWNFYLLNIPSAWSTSQGDNIGVCVIDTGTSPNQPKLGSQFASGHSTGRYIARYGTHVSGFWWWASNDGPDDDCGHGTQMAGLATGPRTSGGSTVGAAYKANLISYRGTTDVIVNSSSEKNGVKDALVAAGNRSDVKIISMSIGDVFSSSKVADGVRYAYNRGKLIFAAAGTSLTWTSWWGVIFPANMSETVAVTGVKEGFPLQRCSNCHDGSQVDFIVPMQRRNNNSRTSLTLAMSGNVPAYVGGSSAATATTAGIAALVWATSPGSSRTTILNRLKNAASIYPGRDNNFGWGMIDANYAVNN
ncbi:MAG: S8 family serine peptidase [Bacteroidota bacterium]